MLDIAPLDWAISKSEIHIVSGFNPASFKRALGDRETSSRKRLLPLLDAPSSRFPQWSDVFPRCVVQFVLSILIDDA
jgi:hypothetical protein